MYVFFVFMQGFDLEFARRLPDWVFELESVRIQPVRTLRPSYQRMAMENVLQQLKHFEVGVHTHVSTRRHVLPMLAFTHCTRKQHWAG